uniref:Uncharacterized protein n=1 Tax=Anguilla anguilla TaxID=7936 RepID=A0A0E9R0Y7_ANGAN
MEREKPQFHHVLFIQICTQWVICT